MYQVYCSERSEGPDPTATDTFTEAIVIDLSRSY